VANDFLEKILEHKRFLLKEKKAFFQSLKDKIQTEKFSRYKLFKEAISSPGKIHLIAEIKKASPSQGLICQNFDVRQIAKIYVQNHASALSVLTEDKFFLGKIPYIRTVTENFSIPVLAKDFFIDEVQIYEAFSMGASAILLIVGILTDKELTHLLKTAIKLDLDCLVEIHDEGELQRALSAGAEIIGINNRNLHTFEVDLNVSRQIIPQIPKDKVIVVESGIKTHQEIQGLEKLGANAVLIGETFLKAPDIDQKVKEVFHGQS